MDTCNRNNNKSLWDREASRLTLLCIVWQVYLMGPAPLFRRRQCHHFFRGHIREDINTRNIQEFVTGEGLI